MDTRNFKWQVRNDKIELNHRTHIMGILNVTPDSFSDGGHFYDIKQAVEQALTMEEEGADFIDVGGESTRPGSAPISENEELDRIIPVIEKLYSLLKIPISVDTYKSKVARQALEAGAKIVNDISGLHFDPEMAKIVAAYNAGIVIMHIKGTPRDMQKDPQYTDLIEEIIDYLNNGITIACKAGIKNQQIVIDPGIGFGKKLDDNFKIIKELSQFQTLNCPVLVGPSRKSFIGNTLRLPVDQRLEGTIAASTACILNGANILRVHDVKQIKRAAIITDKIKRQMLWD